MTEEEVEATLRGRGLRIRARAARRKSGTARTRAPEAPGLRTPGPTDSQHLVRLRSSTKALSFARTTSLR